TLGALLIVTAGTPADCSTVNGAEALLAVSLAAVAAAAASACATPCPATGAGVTGASPPPPPPPHAASSTARASIAPLPRRTHVPDIPPSNGPAGPPR